MKYIITTLITTIVCAMNVFATAQSPDYVIYKGEKHAIHTNPLSAYFEKNPDKKPEMTSTGCWRGYVATFVVTNETLVLKDIEKEVYDDSKFSRKSIKAEVLGDDKIGVIDWFTGILTLPLGEVENYVHMGYGSTYSHYMLLEIENGKFRKERKLTSDQYKKFRDKQFEEFKKTKEYRDAVKEMGGSVSERDEQFIRSYFSGTISSILLDD